MGVKLQAFKLSGRVEIDGQQAKRDLKELESGAKSTATSFGKLKGEIGGVNGAAGQTNNSLLDTLSNISNIVQSIPLVGGAIKSLASPLMGLAQRGIEFDDIIEQANVGLTTVLGNEKKAGELLQEIQKFTLKTPFQFRDMVSYTQEMVGVGLKAKDVIPTLQALGDALSAVGKGDHLQGAIEALLKMKATGKITAREVDEIALQGIPAWDILAKQIGMTTKQLQKYSQEGKLNADYVIKYLVEGLADDPKYQGAMQRMMKTRLGALSNFQDNLDQLSGQAMQSTHDGMTKALETTNEAFDKGLGKGVAALVNTVGDQVSTGFNLILKGILTGDLLTTVKDGAGNIVHTLADTVKNNAWVFEDDMKRMAEQGYGAFANVFGIQSPSRLMIQAGQFIGEGLQIGLENSYPQALAFIQQQERVIIARVGDSLAKIAERYQVSLDELKRRYPQLDPNHEFTDEEAGQRIYLPNDQQWQLGARGKSSRRTSSPSYADRAQANYRKLLEREPQFEARLNQLAAYLGIDPSDLLNVMAVETAGTFNPHIENGKGYTGLIQFGSSARRTVGVTNEQLKGMSATEQLDYVQKYFEAFGAVGRMRTLADVYNIVSGGENLKRGFPLDPNSIVYSGGTPGYNGNRAWDWNADGKIQNWELGQIASERGGFSRANPLPVTLIQPPSEPKLLPSPKPPNQDIPETWLGSIGSSDNWKQKFRAFLSTLTQAELTERMQSSDMLSNDDIVQWDQEFNNWLQGFRGVKDLSKIRGEEIEPLEREYHAYVQDEIEYRKKVLDVQMANSRALDAYYKELEIYNQKIKAQQEAAAKESAPIAGTDGAFQLPLPIPSVGNFADLYHGPTEAALKAFNNIKTTEIKINDLLHDDEKTQKRIETTAEKRANVLGRRTQRIPFASGRRMATLTDEDGNEVDPTKLQGAMAGLKDAAKDLEKIGKDQFGAFAQGLGQMVSDYVLLGDVGPDALRKLTAQTLASVAQEAAVRAIFELAAGFASLFWNPAEASAHFTAAALYGSIAGVSAIAGRAVAGDLFKNNNNSQSTADVNAQYSDSSNSQNVFTRQANAGNAGQAGDAARLRAQGGGGLTYVFGRLLNTLDRIDAIDQNTLIGQMGRSNPEVFSAAVLRSLDSDPQVARGMGRRLGLS